MDLIAACCQGQDACAAVLAQKDDRFDDLIERSAFSSAAICAVLALPVSRFVSGRALAISAAHTGFRDLPMGLVLPVLCYFASC